MRTLGRRASLVEFGLAFYREESGQDLLEYALVLATVLLAVVAGSNSVATTISGAINSLNTRILNTIS